MTISLKPLGTILIVPTDQSAQRLTVDDAPEGGTSPTTIYA